MDFPSSDTLHVVSLLLQIFIISFRTPEPAWSISIAVALLVVLRQGLYPASFGKCLGGAERGLGNTEQLGERRGFALYWPWRRTCSQSAREMANTHHSESSRAKCPGKIPGIKEVARFVRTVWGYR